MKSNRFAFLTSLVITAFMLAGTSPSTAETTPPPICVNVGGTGGCFASIQAAVNAATTGTTINVSAGTYFENVTINQQEKPKKLTLTLVGAGAGSTIADRSGLGSVFNVGKTSLTLTGMTIQKGNAGTGGGGGVSATKAAITIDNCVIAGNQAAVVGG
jgi:pectin methylesterase-like acyl-CoA thioesterase